MAPLDKQDPFLEAAGQPQPQVMRRASQASQVGPTEVAGARGHARSAPVQRKPSGPDRETAAQPAAPEKPELMRREGGLNHVPAERKPARAHHQGEVHQGKEMIRSPGRAQTEVASEDPARDRAGRMDKPLPEQTAAGNLFLKNPFTAPAEARAGAVSAEPKGSHKKEREFSETSAKHLTGHSLPPEQTTAVERAPQGQDSLVHAQPTTRATEPSGPVHGQVKSFQQTVSSEAAARARLAGPGKEVRGSSRTQRRGPQAAEGVTTETISKNDSSIGSPRPAVAGTTSSSAEVLRPRAPRSDGRASEKSSAVSDRGRDVHTPSSSTVPPVVVEAIPAAPGPVTGNSSLSEITSSVPRGSQTVPSPQVGRLRAEVTPLGVQRSVSPSGQSESGVRSAGFVAERVAQPGRALGNEDAAKALPRRANAPRGDGQPEGTQGTGQQVATPDSARVALRTDVGPDTHPEPAAMPAKRTWERRDSAQGSGERAENGVPLREVRIHRETKPVADVSKVEGHPARQTSRGANKRDPEAAPNEPGRQPLEASEQPPFGQWVRETAVPEVSASKPAPEPLQVNQPGCEWGVSAATGQGRPLAGGVGRAPAPSHQEVHREQLEALASHLSHGVRLLVNSDQTRVVLRLEEEGLGRIAVDLARHEHSVVAQFSVELPQTMAILEGSLSELRTLLSEQGIQLGQLSVALDQGQGEAADHRPEWASTEPLFPGVQAAGGSQPGEQQPLRPRMFGYNTIELTA